MKKILLPMLIALVVISTTSCGAEIYPRTMVVTEINEEADVVTLTDAVGFEWEFYGVEDWAIGDICSCIMNDNGTENIEDDEIVKTRYNGNIN